MQLLLSQVIDDPTAPVVLPRAWVQQLLDEATAPRAVAPGDRIGPEPPGGYTIVQVANALERSGTAVWRWISEGLIPGAYRFRGREWRIPRAALLAFIDREQNPIRVPKANLRAWRRAKHGSVRSASASSPAPLAPAR